MNKITTTLAGLAVLATASAIPASAQTFTAPAPFTFSYSPTTFSVNSITAMFNPLVGSTIMGTLSLTGGTSTNGISYTGTTLSFVGGGFTDTETGITAFVFPNGPTTDLISGTTPFTSFVLSPGTAAPVPEASTVISFGALLALGGLAILRRKSTVQNAA